MAKTILVMKNGIRDQPSQGIGHEVELGLTPTDRPLCSRFHSENT